MVLKYLSSLLIGIIFSIYSYNSYYYYFSILIIPLFFVKKINKFYLIWIYIGFFLGLISLSKQENPYPFIKINKSYLLKAEVTDIYYPNQYLYWLKKYNYTIIIKAIKIQGKWQKVNFKTLLLLKYQKIKFEFKDIITIQGNFSLPSNKSYKNDFDYQSYLKRKKIFYLLNLEKTLSHNTQNSLQKNIYTLRDKYLHWITQKFSLKDKKSLTSLFFSFKGSLPYQLKETFIFSGLIHIFTVSGLHLGILIGIIFFLLKISFVPLRTNYILTLLICFIYLFMIGFPTPATRAYLMITFWFLGNILYYPTRPINNLAIVAFVLLLYSPLFILDIGFLYSFSIVFFLLLSMKSIFSLINIINEQFYFSPKEKRLHFSRVLLNQILVLILFSSVAFLSSLGITVFTQQFISYFSWFFNLFSSFLLFCLFFLFILNIFQWEFLISIQKMILEIFYKMANIGGEFIIYTEKPYLFLVIIYYIFFFLFFYLKDFKKKIISFIILLSIIILWGIQPLIKSQKLNIFCYKEKDDFQVIILTPSDNYLITKGKMNYKLNNFLRKNNTAKIQNAFILKSKNRQTINIKTINNYFIPNRRKSAFKNYQFSYSKNKKNFSLKIILQKNKFILLILKGYTLSIDLHYKNKLIKTKNYNIKLTKNGFYQNIWA